MNSMVRTVANEVKTWTATGSAWRENRLPLAEAGRVFASSAAVSAELFTGSLASDLHKIVTLVSPMKRS